MKAEKIKRIPKLNVFSFNCVDILNLLFDFIFNFGTPVCTVYVHVYVYHHSLMWALEIKISRKALNLKESESRVFKLFSIFSNTWEGLVI